MVVQASPRSVHQLAPPGRRGRSEYAPQLRTYNGAFHFTALRTLGAFRTMSASRRFLVIETVDGFQPLTR